MKLSPLLLLTSLALPALGQQTKLNRPLQRELDSILVVDQKYRGYLVLAQNQVKADSLTAQLGLAKGKLFDYAIGNMLRTDESNLRRMEVILQRYGYPGKSLVGTPANETAFYVIQHSDKIPHYLPLIEKAAKQQEIPFKLYALMLDRYLMGEGKEQIYGTQGMTYRILNKQTSQPEEVSFIWPVADAAHVDARRRKAGFPDSFDHNARRMMGESYRVVTLPYALQIRHENELFNQQREKQ
jgi:hypothetical protein